jgi:hypothetical protein
MIMPAEPLYRVKYKTGRHVAIWEFTEKTRLALMQSLVLDVARRRSWMNYFDLVRVCAGIRRAQPNRTTVVRKRVRPCAN